MEADPRETTYRDVERMLDKLTWDICPDRNLWEEYRSKANEAYCEAYNNYTPGRSQFSTWVYIWVRGKLRNYRQQDQTRRQRFGTGDPIGMGNMSDERPHRMEDLLRDVSEDARLVIRVLLETPGDFARMARHPKRTRRELWGRLRGIGWTMGRVVESVDEIKEAIQ